MNGAMQWVPGSLQLQEAVDKLSKRHGQRVLIRFRHDHSAEVLGLRWLRLNRFQVQPDGAVTLIDSQRSRQGGRTLTAVILGTALVVTGVVVGIAMGGERDWLDACVATGTITLVVAAMSAPKLERLVEPGERWTRYGRHWRTDVE